MGTALGSAVGAAVKESRAPPPQPMFVGVKPAMESFNSCSYLPSFICCPMIPCICQRMCSKYEEKKNWNIQRMGEDFDECLFYKRSFCCCCVLLCDCCCATCCSCFWVSAKEKQKKRDQVASMNIAKLEGTMGLAVNREKMTPQQYEAYLMSKRKVEEDALKAATKPPPSRSVRDIKLMIVQSMIENGDHADALQILSQLDQVKDSDIEKFREETQTSLRTKGLRVVAGVLQVVGAVVPVAGAVGMVAGFAADLSEYQDKKQPVQQKQPAPPAEYTVAVAVPASPTSSVATTGSDYNDFLMYQQFVKMQNAHNPMQQAAAASDGQVQMVPPEGKR